MAIVDKVRPETIERMRGVIDFYMLRGITPVARSWPKKPKPPYTALQAESMAVFALANKSMHFLSDKMVKKWQEGSKGVSPSWTDTYRKLIMHYWKIKKDIPVIATNYNINETETSYQIIWDILKLYVPPDTREESSQIQTNIMDKEDLKMATLPVYLTLYDDDNIRQCAPYILFEGKV